MPTFEALSHAPGEVVVVPSFYSDRFAEKRRSALAISNEKAPSQGFLWLVMITGAENSNMAHDLKIADLPKAGLSAPSIVRPTKIANIEPSRIIRRAGRLGPAQSEIIFKAARSFIGR
jgi:mRNA interferase MazF